MKSSIQWEDALISCIVLTPGHLRRAEGESVGLLDVVGVVAHGGAQFLHRRRGLLQRSGLLLGAPGQVLVALRNLRTGGGHLPAVARTPFMTWSSADRMSRSAASSGENS